MKLTSKGRYAVMAILQVAPRNAIKPITLMQISRQQNISLNYLEQIFLKLKKAGIVRSIKGPGGGYILCNELSEIKIADIIDAVNENTTMTRCSIKHQENCIQSRTKCNAHDLWKGLEKHIRNYFEVISIADVIEGNYDLPRS